MWGDILVSVALTMIGLERAGDQVGGWIGKRVITRYGTTLKVGSRVVNDEGRGRAYAASEKDRRTRRVYRVARVEGLWLWLVSETQGASGWAKRWDVVPSERAIDDATAAIRSNPSPATYNSRGLAWHETHWYDRAIIDFNTAIRLDPRCEAAYQNRANSLEAQGRYSEALADYNTAIRLDAAFDLPYNSRAWMRATCSDAGYRDGKQAVADALRACQLGDWKEADYVGTLAAACAEAGDFNAAVRWQTEALRLHRGGAEDRRGFAERLELYKARKPYRVEPKSGRKTKGS